MDNREIYKIAKAFRAAIISARNDREFNYRDRMSNFPRGCCDDSCDLLAHYLYYTHNICSRQKVGTYRDNNPNNTTNHAWLVLHDGTIIDITGDQFRNFAEYMKDVYVGQETPFYKRLERKQIQNNFDITQDSRLKNDYQIIMNHIIYP